MASPSNPSSPTIALNDGNSIPTVGLGVWQTPADDTERAVTAALAAGYRHVDTAAAYGNESEVGLALKGAAAAGTARDDVHAELGIRTEAWSPLGQGSLLENATVAAIADAHGKMPAQALIRWHVQLGNIVIPKSVNPERIVSNFDVFDFELGEQDMESIDSLADGTRLGPDPRTFNFTG
jgi:diketogulonate reductase-like aldo/keto reductase